MKDLNPEKKNVMNIFMDFATAGKRERKIQSSIEYRNPFFSTNTFCFLALKLFRKKWKKKILTSET